jgi:ferredoxin-NADP reductase
MRVRLREKRAETAEAMSFLFDLEGGSYEYLAGQFTVLELERLAFPDERGSRRYLTISSSPTEQGLLMFTTKLTGSGFKETLRQAALGSEVTVEPARGRFVMLPGEERLRHVFIAGGIGITPYRSLLRSLVDRKISIQATLFYFERSLPLLVFRRELEDMERQTPSFSLVPVIREPDPEWRGETGKFDRALLDRHVPTLEDTLFWICGPPLMVSEIKDILRQMGIPEGSLRTDSFTGY